MNRSYRFGSIIALTLLLFASSMALSLPVSQPVLASSQDTPQAPAGFPGLSNLTNWGTPYAKTIESSAQFQSLAQSVAYHLEPYSSFGYTWGPGIDPRERIILFKADGGAYIVSDVDLVTSKIVDMYFVNASGVAVRNDIVNSQSTPNWGGYVG